MISEGCIESWAHKAAVCGGRERHAWSVFCVTEAEAAAIRAVYLKEGELTAAIELRRLFPSIPDNAQTRAHSRMIAGWQSLPAHPGFRRRGAVARALAARMKKPAWGTPGGLSQGSGV